MAGTEDKIVDVDDHAVWFHDALPGSELRLVPGTGHMFHYAVPEQVAEAITATVKRQDNQIGHCEPALCCRTRTPAGGVIASWAAIGRNHPGGVPSDSTRYRYLGSSSR